MKVITFFSLFVFVTSEVPELDRELFPPTSSEIQNYIANLAKIKDFQQNMDDNFTKIASYFVVNETDENKFEKVYSSVTLLKEIFIRIVFYYVKNYLLIYYQIAEELINRRLQSGTFDEDIVNRIKFEKDLDDYCVVSVLFNSEYDIKPMFHMIFYLQTFYNDSKLMESKSTVIDMKKLRSDFNFHYNLEENYNKTIIKDDESDKPIINLGGSDEKLFEVLLATREDFKTMTKSFCSSTQTVPFLRRSLMFGERVNNNYKDGYFNFVTSIEQCVVEFIKSPNVYNSSKEVIESHWYCGVIMTNPIYEFGDYFEDLQLTESEKLKHNNDHKYYTTAQVEAGKKVFLQRLAKENLKTYHSLVSIRKQLRDHYYYLDVFLYNQIETNVLLFSAMKEGNKYFRAINNFFHARCKKAVINISDDEFQFMRSRVFLFQLYYDKLTNEIIEKLHYSFDNAAQTIFRNGTKELLQHLDFPKIFDENERKKLLYDTCEDMKNTVGYEEMGDYAGYELENLKFVEYNYDDPILNTYKLINFIEP